MTDDPHQKFQDILADFDTAMLVTVDREGGLRSRPMQIACAEDDGDLWFVTSLASGKAQEIAADVRCAVTMQSAREFLSLTGTSELVRDPQRLRRMWTEAWRPWFPEGPEDPQLGLIHFEAEEAEYWDMSGVRAARYLFEAAKAVLSGEEIETGDPGQHASVPL